MRLENKVAFVSGGARGMGSAEANLFAREGAKVVIGSRRPHLTNQGVFRQYSVEITDIPWTRTCASKTRILASAAIDFDSLSCRGVRVVFLRFSPPTMAPPTIVDASWN